MKNKHFFSRSLFDDDDEDLFAAAKPAKKDAAADKKTDKKTDAKADSKTDAKKAAAPAKDIKKGSDSEDVS